MSISKTAIFLFRTTLVSLCVFAAQAQAAPYYAYSWTTTNQGYGPHVDQPSHASFDVAAAVIQTGTIGYNDIYNIQMAYPDLSFDNTTVTSNGLDDAVYVDPATGALKFLDAKLGEATGNNVVNLFYYGVSNQDVMDGITDPTLKEAFSIGDPTILEKTNFTPNLTADQRDAWTKMWAEVKAAP